MAGINSSILPASALLNEPFILNFPLASANTEYTITVPAGAKAFILQARGQTTLKISEAVGQSGVTYWTVHPYANSGIHSVKGTNAINLYVQSTKASQVLELWYWN